MLLRRIVLVRMAAAGVLCGLLALPGCVLSPVDDPGRVICEQGDSRACVCTDGSDATQGCADDGLGWDRCRCEGSPAPDQDAGPPPDVAGASDGGHPQDGGGTSDSGEPPVPEGDWDHPDNCQSTYAGRTLGLVSCNPTAQAGYTLFAPIPSTTTYLVDMLGHPVHSWRSNYRPGNAAYLLDSGNLLRTGSTGRRGNGTFEGGGAGGVVQELGWSGEVLWEFRYDSDQYLSHHDVERLPNGNVLIVAWEYRSAEQAIEAGRDPDRIAADAVWPDHLVEVAPSGADGGDIVWEWHLWDHLVQDFDPDKDNYGVVEDHPELLDINFVGSGRNAGAPDWNHVNSVQYNPALDQVVISSHNQSELYVIDHSTTTEEARGHAGGRHGRGGDLLYRWGNPQVYRAGRAADQQLFQQHDVQWIEPGLPGAGNLLIYNNGNGRPSGRYSSIEEIEPPVDDQGLGSTPPTTGRASFRQRSPAPSGCPTATRSSARGVAGASSRSPRRAKWCGST
jgi:hypothetical protein